MVSVSEAAGGHDVVEDEAALVHLRQQIGAEAFVGEVGADDEERQSERRASKRPGQSDQSSARAVPARTRLRRAGPVLVKSSLRLRLLSRLASRSRRGRGRGPGEGEQQRGEQRAVMVMASARKKLPVTPVTAISGRKTTTG